MDVYEVQETKYCCGGCDTQHDTMNDAERCCVYTAEYLQAEELANNARQMLGLVLEAMLVGEEPEWVRANLDDAQEELDGMKEIVDKLILERG